LPLELAKTVRLSQFGWQGVPHSWASDGKTPVTVGGMGTSDGAKSRVRRTESTRPDIGDELTVICQVRWCQAGQERSRSWPIYIWASVSQIPWR